MARTDLNGYRFGSLTAVLWMPGRKWMCLCDCGSFKEYWQINLRSGRQTSCGFTCPESKWHGHATRNTREYRTWGGMMARCYSETCKAFKNYGARGIKVCERWHSFKNFLADMGERPAGTSVDRINNNGDYEPGNCRWANAKTQARNMRTTRLNESLVADLRAGKLSIKTASEMAGAGYTTAWKAARGLKWN